MDAALRSIYGFRQRDPQTQNLGKWSPVIELFDQYRDGKSSTRLRELLENKMVG